MTANRDGLKKPLTRKGWQRIAEEHRQLLEVERPKIVDNMATAAAEGDRSENAEYIYSRKRMREIDKRLRYLTGLLKDAEIIDPENIRDDRIGFAATFTLEDEEGETRTWTIVGLGEAEAVDHTISWQSPVAKALWGKKLGDTVTIRRPIGDWEVTIIDLHYAGKRKES